MMKILKEPLLHFVILGGLIFAAYAWTNGFDSTDPSRIVVSLRQQENLARTFERTWQRPPTQAELNGLIVDFLRQESVNLPWGATFTIITGRESEHLFDTLVYLRRIGLAVTLILVQPSRPSDELRRRADILGVPIHRVWREQDLETWGLTEAYG